MEAKIRDTNASAALKEFKLAEKMGEYILASDAEKEHAEEVARVKAKLLAIPAKMTPQVTGLTEKEAVYSLLSSAIEEALNELAGTEGKE